VTDPLRVGILGAARIAPLSIVSPAVATGTRLVAVAARDRSRAMAFAAEHGVERVLDGYEDVLADPEVEAVYNPLPNALHGPWNARAAAAGRHVLAEKPSAANAAEARSVAAAVRDAGVVFMEAFHFPYHPLFRRALELVEDGAIGDVVHVDVPLLMPDPGEDDPRWRLDLAGGSTMDLGCYSLACLSLIGQRTCGGAPSITSARAVERRGQPGVDSSLFLTGEFPSGATASGGSDMDADDWSFTLVVTGSEGEIVVPKFPLPHEDDRLILRPTPSAPRSRTRADEADDLCQERDGDVVEHLGTRSSYTHQLEAFAAAVRNGAPVVTDATFAIANAELVDASYTAAGLPLRPSRDA
jgi:predicted dehydrogenase